MKTLWKGLIMAVVGFLATTIADLEVVNWWYVLISTVAFTLIYIGKNFFLPSTSEPGKINWMDAFSGVLIAIGMMVSSMAGSILTTGTVDWRALGVAVIGAIVGYFTKTFFSSSTKT